MFEEFRNELIARGFITCKDSFNAVEYKCGSMANYEIVRIWMPELMTSLPLDRSVYGCHIYYESFSEPGYLEVDSHERKDFNLPMEKVLPWLKEHHIYTKEEFAEEREKRTAALKERVKAVKEERAVRSLLSGTVKVTIHGIEKEWPLIDFLEYQAQQNGFDDVEDLLGNGYSFPGMPDITYTVYQKYLERSAC